MLPIPNRCRVGSQPSGNQTASSLSAVRRAATHGEDGPGGAGGPGGKGGTHGVTIKRARLCILGCWFYNSEQVSIAEGGNGRKRWAVAPDKMSGYLEETRAKNDNFGPKNRHNLLDTFGTFVAGSASVAI